MTIAASLPDLETRARQTGGTSHPAIYGAIARELSRRRVRGQVLLDVGCGLGRLWPYVCDCFAEYWGIDAVRYDGFPKNAKFLAANLDTGRLPLPDRSADVVVAAELIEHLENPRALVRELVRVAKPHGLLMLTTPNQLSFLSLITLFIKGHFNAFQDVHYPAHLTALLPVDLTRIGKECGLIDLAIEYTGKGRIPLTRWHYPSRLAAFFQRACSDNLLLIGKRTAS